MRYLALFIALITSFSFLNAQTVLYVDKDAAQGGNGSNWSSAFKYLNDAISYANNNSDTFYQIWVAEGTYYTDEGALYSNDDQNSVFNIPNNVLSLIGGFSGNEQSEDEANPKQYLTKLSGLIFEEYGATGIGSSYLFTATGGNSLTVSGFSFNNASDQGGCILNLSSSRPITFEFCNFSDNQSTENLIEANQNTVFRNCRFERNQASDGYLIAYGDFESCFFNENVVYNHLIYSAGIIDRSIITNNVSSYYASSIILYPGRITNSVIFRNRGGEYIIRIRNGTQVLNSTFVDNYTWYSADWSADINGTSGYFTVGSCIFFRSAFNRSPILGDDAVVGYKSSVNLPVQSSFFGILDCYDSRTLSGTTYLTRLFDKINQTPYIGSTVFKNTYFKVFEAHLPEEMIGINPYSVSDYNELINNSTQLFGSALCNNGDSYLPEFTQEFDIEYPDPFINSSDPLGPDGEPFTEDDGLRLDPNSEWASEVINVPTIDADYELTDILGNNRIIGDLIDLGAYEYIPLEDADGDGISDSNDAFPNNANETLDTDGDGLGDNEDSDDDGDGVDDSVEIATGTDPKQYNSALHSFVQTLGGGTFDADDIAESRLAGQSDVTSDPNTFNLFTQAELTSATEIGNTQGQNAVTSDPNSFGLFSSNDISTAQAEFRILGQQDVVSDPLSYGLYSPSYTIGLIDASREAGREDVTSDPSAYGLQAISGSGSNSNSSNVPTSLAGLIEVYKSEGFNEDINGNGILDSGEDINGNGILDSQNGFVEAVYYTSETLFSTGDDQNIYSWDPENKLLQGTSASGLVEWRWVYEFVDTQESGIYVYKYKAYDGNVIITEEAIPEGTGYGFFYSADGDLDENGSADKIEFYNDDSFFGNDLDNFFGDETSIISNDFPNSLPELQASDDNDGSSGTIYSLEDLEESRLAGQNEVIFDPNTFNLYSEEDIILATETGNSQGQNLVISDPRSFGLFTASEVTAIRSFSRSNGQEDVVNNPSAYGLHSLEEIKDLRAGSTMIEIHNGQATLTMEVEESDDLGVWTNGGATSIQIPIDAEAGKKFFRFKMADLVNDADTNPQFQIIEGNFTWEEARVDAISRNGRLAVLDTEAKQSLIENMIQNDLKQNLTTQLRFAIGLSDHLTEGDWRWIDGSQLSYSNWGPNEPNGTSGYDQDYGVLTTGWWSGTESEFGKWNDDVLIFNYSNVYLNGYILEIPIP